MEEIMKNVGYKRLLRTIEQCLNDDDSNHDGFNDQEQNIFEAKKLSNNNLINRLLMERANQRLAEQAEAFKIKNDANNEIQYVIKSDEELRQVLSKLNVLLESTPGYFDLIMSFIINDGFSLSGSMLLWAMSENSNWVPQDADLYKTKPLYVNELNRMHYACECEHCYRQPDLTSPWLEKVHQRIVDHGFHAQWKLLTRSNLCHKIADDLLVPIDNCFRTRGTMKVVEAVFPSPGQNCQSRKTQFLFSTESVLSRIDEFDFNFLCNYLGLRSGIDSKIAPNGPEDGLVLLSLSKVANSIQAKRGVYNPDIMDKIENMWNNCNEFCVLKDENFDGISAEYVNFANAFQSRIDQYDGRGYNIKGFLPPARWAKDLPPSRWIKDE